MKIGYVQFEPVLGDRDETVRRLDPLIDEGRAADLLVLPELANSGYNFTSREMAEQLAESSEDGPFVRYLRGKCGEHNLHIAAGLDEKAGDHVYNSAVLVGPDGLVGVYRKLHLFLREKDVFRPGDLGLPIFDVGGCKVAMLICFDWTFPEVWRIVALGGADVICHPSNLVLPGFAQQAVPVHALINRVFVVTANRIGTERDLTYTGQSIIAGARGEVLARAPAASPEVRIVDVDLAAARDKAVTERNDIFGDRRPEAYGDILRDA